MWQLIRMPPAEEGGGERQEQCHLLWPQGITMCPSHSAPSTLTCSPNPLYKFPAGFLHSMESKSSTNPEEWVRGFQASASQVQMQCHSPSYCPQYGQPGYWKTEVASSPFSRPPAHILSGLSLPDMIKQRQKGLLPLAYWLSLCSPCSLPHCGLHSRRGVRRSPPSHAQLCKGNHRPYHLYPPRYLAALGNNMY